MRKGFTVVEVLIALLVLFALWMIIYPGIDQARQLSEKPAPGIGQTPAYAATMSEARDLKYDRGLSCQAAMNKIINAMQNYMQDYDCVVPSGTAWSLTPYLVRGLMPGCPSGSNYMLREELQGRSWDNYADNLAIFEADDAGKMVFPHTPKATRMSDLDGGIFLISGEVPQYKLIPIR